MIDSMPLLNPTAGILSIPLAGLGNCQNSGMRPRQILAANLKALMEARPDLDLLPKITSASDGRLSNGKLDRIRRAAATTDIDTLEDLADTFGIEPWQLLVEGLNPNALQMLQQIKAFITTQPIAKAVNSDSMGIPERKAANSPHSKEHNENVGPKFGPALSKFFNTAKGGKNERSNSNAPPAKKRGARGT